MSNSCSFPCTWTPARRTALLGFTVRWLLYLHPDADKRARFVVARGEVAELDATIEAALLLALVPSRRACKLRVLAARVGAMLTGLIRRLERRIG